MERQTERRRPTARRIGLYTVLGALVAFYLLPLEAGIMTSIKTSDAFARTVPFAPPGPDGFTLSAWGTAWETLRPMLVDSVLLAVPAALLSALFGSLAAYGLTNVDWRGQVAVVVLFVAGIFIPYQAVLVPLARFWRAIELFGVFGGYESLVHLIITHTAYGIPITTLLFRAYYKNFSSEMLEAARLDGASTFGVYRSIVLPLSTPMFAVTLIYQFTQVWNDLLFALILLSGADSSVVTLGLAQLGGGLVSTFNTEMAGAFIAAFPTLLVYIIFGDKFARGVAGQT
ncbi:carbohydrate ABC transporter permease [Halomarina ordinaria]|uniref:Carbohydrate ABC transporter permease n=1 Tax=Halomarina ordinaria TaxID=3033939 RepID=A0ABD5U8X4_9EURY|nr:carbohydrate ABC transporter permease [Halomarina sp. PSRA2]